MASPLEQEYTELMAAYIEGRATSAKLRRLNEIVGGNRGLAADLDNHVGMHEILSQYGKQKPADVAPEDIVEAAESDAPIPLVGPEQPPAVVCVFKSARGKIHPHMTN